MTSLRPRSSLSGLCVELVVDIFANVYDFDVVVGFLIEVFEIQEKREQKHLQITFFSGREVRADWWCLELVRQTELTNVDGAVPLSNL
jgi:hypothetical protein